MLVFDNRNTFSHPVILCEACREQITETELGMVFLERLNDGISTRMWFAHKGDCDNQLKATVGADSPWIELYSFLTQLCFNSGLTLKTISEEYQVMQEYKDEDSSR